MINPADFFKHFPAGDSTERRGDVIASLIHGCGFDVSEIKDEESRSFIVRRGSPKHGLVFEAHYDIATCSPKHENCQDNTASVCHLLTLLKRDDFVGTVAFCDGEERVNFHKSGAKRVAARLLFERAVNPALPEPFVASLELTANGSAVWAEAQGNAIGNDHPLDAVASLSCPFNNAVWFRRAGIGACCVGTVQQADLTTRFSPKSWMLCHMAADKFELASRPDMQAFNDTLVAWAVSSEAHASTTRA